MMKSRSGMYRPSMFLLVGLLGLALAACGEEGAIPASADVALPACDNEIDGLTQYLTSEGIRTAFLQADRGCLWQNSDTIVVEGFRLTVYQDETGVEQAVVTGERGVLNTVTERMRANGNAVLFIPAQGRRIESEELFYDPQANRMYSDSATTMYLEGRIIEGSGFESDLSFENPTIRQFRTRPGPAVPPGVPEPAAAPTLPDPEGASGEPPGTGEGAIPPVPDTAGNAPAGGEVP
jgi:LPS export ABC transporter protein LptC